MIQFLLAFSGVAIFPLFSDQTKLGLFERRLKLDCFFCELLLVLQGNKLRRCGWLWINSIEHSRKIVFFFGLAALLW